MSILTYQEDFIELRHEIKKSMPTWISKLDPSDIRISGDNPEVAKTQDLMIVWMKQYPT
jgi:hypothetical protein